MRVFLLFCGLVCFYLHALVEILCNLAFYNADWSYFPAGLFVGLSFKQRPFGVLFYFVGILSITTARYYVWEEFKKNNGKCMFVLHIL